MKSYLENVLKKKSIGVKMPEVFSKDRPDVTIIIANQEASWAKFIIHQVNKMIRVLRDNDYRYNIIIGSRVDKHTNFVGIDSYNEDDKNVVLDNGERSRGTASFFYIDEPIDKQLHRLHGLSRGNFIFIVTDASLIRPERVSLQLTCESKGSFCDSNGLDHSETKFFDSIAYHRKAYNGYFNKSFSNSLRNSIKDFKCIDWTFCIKIDRASLHKYKHLFDDWEKQFLK